MEIETETKAKKKHCARRAKTTANPAASLLAALKFLAPTQKKAGTAQQQHCIILNHWAIASNGILTAACPVQDDLKACPHSTLLLEALRECGEELVISQLSNVTLSVKSGEFKALIPCATMEELYSDALAPDPVCAGIDDRIKQAFEAVAPLATDGAAQAHYAAILLQGGSAVATNGAALLEYWHGIDLPPGLLIPKASAVAVIKADKPLTGFGFSANSATFHFQDGSFYKTQLFAERYLAYQNLFPPSVNPWPLPPEFWKAVEAIALFSQEGKLYFEDGFISSHEQEAQASTYRIDGLPNEMGFNAKYLMRVKHAMQTADFLPSRHEVVFFAENMRGILKGLDLKARKDNYDKQYAMPNLEEDDIPF